MSPPRHAIESRRVYTAAVSDRKRHPLTIDNQRVLGRCIKHQREDEDAND